MSSIYIPDVGLPQDGDFELWISIKKDGSYNYNISGGWNKGKQKAILVPPHGRLGDLDELKAKIKKEDNAIYSWDLYGNGMYNAFQSVYQCIDAAPTVIPTEPSEEQREYEAAIEVAQYCEMYELSYDPETGAL